MILSNERFLSETETIDFGNETIQQWKSDQIGSERNEIKIAEKIFYFMRDEIRYAFRVPNNPDEFRASSILRARLGFCTQKAILFCALARACSIPAGIYFFDIIDHSLPDKFEQLLRTRTMYRHGVPTLFLNGKWIKLDATLDSTLLKKNDLTSVEFSHERDCLMSEFARNGKRHINYVAQYGLYADVSFDLVFHWFSLYYEHLF